MRYCSAHTDREAVAECAGCGKALCAECVEFREGDESYCYDCALDRQLTEFREKDEAVKEEQEAVAEERVRKRGGSLAFKIVAAVLSVLILAGAGFILYDHLTRGSSADEGSPEQEVVWGRDECMLTMQEIRDALDRYFEDNDAYPEGLQALEGAYLGIDPVCPASGAPYEYQGTGGGYTISCPNPQEHGAAEITASSDEIPHFKEEPGL